jgi:DNA-binding NarL/FixJ family response regulator
MRQAGVITIKGNKKRVLLVDDHAAVRAGVEALLAREPDLEALPSVAAPNGAIAALHISRPDVVVVDHHLRTGDGLTLTRKLKAVRRPPAVLIYTATADAALTVAAVVAGADGVVSKGGEGDELCEAVRCVAEGRPVRPPVSGDALRSAAESLDSEADPRHARPQDTTRRDRASARNERAVAGGAPLGDAPTADRAEAKSASPRMRWR